jgi:hypothetical protein
MRGRAGTAHLGGRDEFEVALEEGAGDPLDSFDVAHGVGHLVARIR